MARPQPLAPSYLVYISAITIAAIAVFWIVAAQYGRYPNYWSLGLHLALGLSGVWVAAWVHIGLSSLAGRVQRWTTGRDTDRPTPKEGV